MTYASPMVFVEQGPETTARVALLGDRVERFEARVIRISASQPDTFQVDPYAGGAMLGEMIGNLHGPAEFNAKQAEAKVWKAADDHVGRCEWRERGGARARS